MAKRFRETVSHTVHPRWLHYLSQFAEHDRRSKSNMLEVLIEQEYNRRVADGIVFDMYPGDSAIIGEGAEPDTKLQEQFEKFMGGKP